MAAETTKEEEKQLKPREITFKCQRCEKDKPLKDMVSISRFRPVLIVCRDCAKEMR